VLYATSARLGGSGLDVTSLQGALASHRAGILGSVHAYADQQQEIPSEKVHSAWLQPARLCSFLGSERYYGVKKQWLDRVVARVVAGRQHDFLHSWSGDAFRSLLAAVAAGIPSVLDIPTWHRNKGRAKPFVTKSEREGERLRGLAGLSRRLLVSRQQVLMEYELATLLLMPSVCSAATFRAAGLSADRLHYVGRGVDVAKFCPSEPAERLRFVFVGALIRRKGVHRILEAWRRLGWRHAELVLVGAVHDELRGELRELPAGVTLTGFVKDVGAVLSGAAAFVFPSECEGFAKATLEAAACGVPLIATRESGDAVVDGQTGWLVPADDAEALAGAMAAVAGDRDEAARRGREARQFVERHFTWDHYRRRVLAAYGRAREIF
jgi:glycosyltransferase involved in cell wall biosynthesis